MHQGARYRSRGLAALHGRIHGADPGTLLDLGSPNQSFIDSLTGLPVRLRVEDLPQRVHERLAVTGNERWHKVLNDSRPTPQSLASTLEPRDGEQYDVIMAWDLLNYMHVNTLVSFMTWLSRACSRGTLLHCLTFQGNTMPANPVTWSLSAGEFEVAAVDEDHSPCPRFAPGNLARMMPGFSIDKLYQLGDGIQEQVFVFDSIAPQPDPLPLGGVAWRDWIAQDDA